MKPFTRLSRGVTFRNGIIVFGAMVVLAISSTSARRVGLAVLAAAAVGIPPAAVAAPAENDGTAIRPFRLNVPEATLADLRPRVAATRWPDRQTITDQSRGVPLAKLQALVRPWGTDYDWRKAEATLNAWARTPCCWSWRTAGPARSSSC